MNGTFAPLIQKLLLELTLQERAQSLRPTDSASSLHICINCMVTSQYNTIQ